MKRLLTLLLSFCFIFNTTITADAKSPVPNIANQLEYIGNGYYAEVNLSILSSEKNFTFSHNKTLSSTSLSKVATKQRTASKTYTIKNLKGKTVASYTLTGTFTYNGSSSTCIKSSCSTSISNSDYRFTKKTANRSGNTATGSFTLSSPIQTISKTLTLKCSPSGTIQ